MRNRHPPWHTTHLGSATRSCQNPALAPKRHDVKAGPLASHSNLLRPKACRL